MKVPNRCIDCRFRSKDGVCWNYCESCEDIAQECQDDDDYEFIHWQTNGRTLLTLDEINELKRTEKIYEQMRSKSK